MSCYHPLDGYRQPSGSVKIGFEPPGSVEKVRIPCGSCFGCRMEYAENWSVRCTHEAKLWDHNYFITLTYDDEHLPPFASLRPEDLQRFWKRLRKAVSGHREAPDGSGEKPVRYFACGEYGSRTDRPHYHALLFNVALDMEQGHSEILERAWPHGSHLVSEFTPGRARYVAGYAAKKVKGRIASDLRYSVINETTGELVKRVPEFNRMSRKPGIGVWYFERYRQDFFRGFVTDPGGVKRRLPRYYRDRLLSDPDFEYADELRRGAWEVARDRAEDKPERMHVRETVHKARLGLRSKERGF